MRTCSERVAAGKSHCEVIGPATGSFTFLQRSPVRIMLPTVEGNPVTEAVIVNTGGRVTGDD